MKIKDADGTVFDLPKAVATGLARSASNTFELVVDEPEDTGTPGEPEPARTAPATPPPADPAEAPTQAWTNARIAAWAKGRVDLGSATKKDDMLAAIAAASIAQTAAALDAALTPDGQDPVITGAELEDDGAGPDDQDTDEPAPADAGDLAEDEDDTLEPDDPEPEDDEPASDGEG